MTADDERDEQPRAGADSPDADPTGVRRLLADLREPGPMPPALMNRISDSLEIEQRHRSGAVDDRVVDLAERRRAPAHRRWLAWGAAAAAAVVVGGGAWSLTAIRDSNLVSSAGAPEVGDAAPAPEGATSSSPPPMADSESSTTAPDNSGSEGGSSSLTQLPVTVTMTDIPEEQLARDLPALLQAAPTAARGSAALRERMRPLLNPSAARACLASIDGTTGDLRRAVVLRVDGTSSVALITGTSSDEQAWTVDGDCRLLGSGPVALSPR